MNEIIKLIPEMKTGQELMECMGEYPDYLPEVREKSSAERLIALSDIYDIYDAVIAEKKQYTGCTSAI